MKKLLFFSFLATLASCNPVGKHKSSIVPYIDPLTQSESLEKASNEIKVGLVIETITTGERHQIHVSSNEDRSVEDHSAVVAEVNDRIREVVLRIDGDRIYKYVESNEHGMTDLRVYIESKEQEIARFEEFLSNAKITKKGDLVSGKINSDANNEKAHTSAYRGIKSASTIDGGKMSFAFTYNSGNPFCTSKITMVTMGSVFQSETITRKLGRVSQTSQASCPEVLSAEELKKIDLSNIKLCDQTKSDSVCEASDLSYLTQDL